MRLEVGQQAPSFVGQTIDGRRVELAALRGRTVLLKFYRFATCPVCNWHMHAFIKDYASLEALGLTTIVLFHSPSEKIARTRRSVAPFDIVADPGRRIFEKYGVERSWAGMFTPAVMWTYALALKAGFPPGLLTSEGGITGNPADFIIDADGQIAFAHYGKHYADTLWASQVADIRRGLGASSPLPPPAATLQTSRV
jgi:peroxiredoxin Q/BCP